MSNSGNLRIGVYHDFIDRYVIRSLRKPSKTIVPQGILDENVQRALQTSFQEYVYIKTKNNFKNNNDEKNLSTIVSEGNIFLNSFESST